MDNLHFSDNNKQLRNVQLVVYFILRNLNNKSSLIIYHCPFKYI
jgi:hypothetical protein